MTIRVSELDKLRIFYFFIAENWLLLCFKWVAG